jgi:hypothetical protein
MNELNLNNDLHWDLVTPDNESDNADVKTRLQNESDELFNKIVDLSVALNDGKLISTIQMKDYRLLVAQHEAMKTYHTILSIRINHLDV